VLPAPFKVVLDANVLYPFSLRDTLLRAAHAGLYQLYWSEEIIDEACRNLVGDRRMEPAGAARLRGAMTAAFPEAMVADYESLVASMRNAPEDRHVAAAAVKAGAQVIVTMNLRDFRDLPEGIEAKSPDEFLCDLFDLNPAVFVELLREQAAGLRNPAVTLEALLNGLARFVPSLVRCVRGAMESGIRSRR
jgi:predicted nucleic acid-binding protein